MDSDGASISTPRFMNCFFIPFAAVVVLGCAAPALVAEEAAAPEPAPALDDAAKKARDDEAKRKEAEQEKVEGELKKEAEPITRRLKSEAAGKLWEVVQKGDDDALKATGLPAATIEILKAERSKFKGLHSILANEKLGRDVLKQLSAYGGSSKFAKAIEDEAKAKEKAEKDRIREKKKTQREREK